AGVVARRSFAGMSVTIAQTLSDVQTEARLAGLLSADVDKAIEAGSRYIDTRDSASQAAFRKFGWAAHAVQQQMNDRTGQSATEVAIVATIDTKLSAMEVHYALAHRLADLGRVDDARAAAAQGHEAVDDLLNNIDRLARLKADNMAGANAQLAAETDR